MTITKLTTINTSDAEALALLSAQLGYATQAETLSLRVSKILTSTYDCIFIARSDGKIIGWIHAFLAVRVETDLFVEIASLVVDQNYRGLQLGKQLIEAVSNWSKTQHFDKLRVRCNVQRTESHQFYEHLGFELEKQQQVFERRV